jgi:hypothetical protein
VNTHTLRKNVGIIVFLNSDFLEQRELKQKADGRIGTQVARLRLSSGGEFTHEGCRF